MAKFTVDLSEDTPDTLDRGRDVEPGWYKCALEDVFDDTKSGATVFEHRILEGKYKNARIFDRINDPALATKDNAADVIMRRVKLLAVRLGLLKADACGQQKELDFVDAIGSTVVVHVEHRKYQDAQGNNKEITSVKFDGVYPLDHEKIPEAVRKALGLPAAKVKGGEENGKRPPLPPAAQAATQSTPPAVVDVSDL
jgi:hypothetical protein